MEGAPIGSERRHADGMVIKMLLYTARVYMCVCVCIVREIVSRFTRSRLSAAFLFLVSLGAAVILGNCTSLDDAPVQDQAPSRIIAQRGSDDTCTVVVRGWLSRVRKILPDPIYRAFPRECGGRTFRVTCAVTCVTITIVRGVSR